MSTPAGECTVDAVEAAIVLEHARRCDEATAAVRAEREAHEATKPRIAKLIAERDAWPELDAEAQRRDEAFARLPWYKKRYYRYTLSICAVCIVVAIGATLSGVYACNFPVSKRTANALFAVFSLCVLAALVSAPTVLFLLLIGPRDFEGNTHRGGEQERATQRAKVLAEINRWFDYENQLASAAAVEGAIQTN